MSRKNVLWVGGSIGATILLLSVLTLGPVLRRPREEGAAVWKQGDIKATYVGTQLKEIDKAHSSLIISYDLENNAGSEYRLAEGPSVLILCRLKSDGSLSQEKPIRLSYPVFLPAKQHARLAIEITQPFAWPADGDPGSLDKMRNFVRQNLETVGEFVLFDEGNRRQVQLPRAWEDL